MYTRFPYFDSPDNSLVRCQLRVDDSDAGAGVDPECHEDGDSCDPPQEGATVSGQKVGLARVGHEQSGGAKSAR